MRSLIAAAALVVRVFAFGNLRAAIEHCRQRENPQDITYLSNSQRLTDGLVMATSLPGHVERFSATAFDRLAVPCSPNPVVFSTAFAVPGYGPSAHNSGSEVSGQRYGTPHPLAVGPAGKPPEEGI